MDASDMIHQIEYRWHDRKDLSPIASTMSPDSLRGWDSWIRTWVRHPHVEGLGESVCYQIDHSTGRAALAWRYEDWQAADRADGTRGRPLVSRVLTGSASQLSPDVAIVLCHTGLPAGAGSPPGSVMVDADLASISADGLAALARDHTAGLDRVAAAQQGCLLRLVAQALADSQTPIAVHLPDADILKPPDRGLPCPLLWGLWRIAGPVLGGASRGWSFSTFELPPGDVDPATMPDILFRQAHYTPRPIARPRKELKIRPFEPQPAEENGEFTELAAWLIDEYQEAGGDRLKQLIESWRGTDRSAQPRISRIYEELQARRAPATPSIPVTPPMPRLPGPEWLRRSEPRSEPMRVQPVIVDPVRVDPVRIEQAVFQPEPVEAQPVEAQPLEERVEPPAVQSAPDAAQLPEPEQPEPGPEPETDPATEDSRRLESLEEPVPSAAGLPSEATGYPQRRPTPARLLPMNALLKKLPEAENFRDIVRDIFDERHQPEYNERLLSRREIFKPDWYQKVSLKSHQDALIDLLAEIFGIVIVPDLELPEVTEKVGQWVDQAAPSVIGGLLAAAKQSGYDSSLKMMEIVQHRLAHRWTVDNDIDDLWYTVTAPPRTPEPDRGGNWFNLRRRN
jgi:hypothetical protein